MTTTSLDIPRLSRDELREVVLGIVDGRILTSEQVPPDLMGMVFMPMMLGAMAPPEDVLPPRPAEPVDVPLPAEPPPLTLPDEPVKPTPPEPPPYPTEQMELVRWGRLLEDDVLPPYREAVARYEAYLDEWRRTAGVAYETALAEHRERCRVLTDKHAARIAKHAATCDAVKVRNRAARAAYDEANAQWETVAKEVYRLWSKDVGVIYEYMDAAGPRSVNGYPIFMSLRIMHREDWDIARPAVQREFDRRKNDDILGEP